MRHIFIWTSGVTFEEGGPDIRTHIAEVESACIGSEVMLWHHAGFMFTELLDAADELFTDRNDMVMIHMCHPKNFWEAHSVFVAHGSGEGLLRRMNDDLLKWAKGIQAERMQMRLMPVLA